MRVGVPRSLAHAGIGMPEERSELRLDIAEVVRESVIGSTFTESG
jgi:hypothetical protein